jgi:hypothetical protein
MREKENQYGGSQNVLHNMSSIPRTEFKVSTTWVDKPPMVFDLSKLITDEDISTTRKNQSIFKALEDISKESVEKRVESLPKFALSVLPSGETSKLPHCEDIELTIAVLSRQCGKFFMASKKPDYTLGHLTSKVFICDNLEK